MQVFTTPATSIPAGYTQITTTKRETGDKKLEPHQRSRSILIPELLVDSVPSKFQKFVIDSLYELARAQLAALWKEQDAALKEVSDAIWSVDSLLMFYSREQESKRLSKSSVEAWFAESKLHAFLVEKADEKLLASWKQRVLSLSAPVIDLNEKQCTVTMATLGKFEEDAESIIGSQLVTKLQRRLDAIKAAATAVTELEEI